MITRANHVPLSPLSFLARARRAFADKVAVVDADGTEVSYAQLGQDCDAMAGGPPASGSRPRGPAAGPGARRCRVRSGTRHGWLAGTAAVSSRPPTRMP